ncbi:ALP1-like protein [Tanacetum coccineum]
MLKTYMINMLRVMVFGECLKALIVCTGIGKNVQSHGMDNTENGVGIFRWLTNNGDLYVKSFTVANDAKHAYFKKRQEGARKDVERAFGVLPGTLGE